MRNFSDGALHEANMDHNRLNVYVIFVNANERSQDVIMVAYEIWHDKADWVCC
jgi:hypothetical protein